MPQTLSEEELWHSFIAGNSIAYERLVSQTYVLMFQYGSKFSKNKDLVKDCIQDVFLNVWEKRHNLDSTIPVRAYLLASLRRRIHRKVQYELIEFNDIEPDSVFDPIFNVEQSLIENEKNVFLSARVAAMLNTLPDRQKEVIYLRFFHELDRNQIAEVMQITPQSVSNFLQKSFTLIRNNWIEASYHLSGIILSLVFQQ